MAIHFEWYETPVPSDKPDEKKVNKLSNVEIDIKLRAYFAEHQLMTRTHFQRICGFMKSKAMVHIRRLKEEGKIRNIGIPTQPVYVPVAGYYGVSRDRIVTK